VKLLRGIKISGLGSPEGVSEFPSKGSRPAPTW
jgi:hypothetical protein